MRHRTSWFLGAPIAALIVGGAFMAGRAWAGGVPSTGALTYSGALLNGDGTPLTGSHGLEVQLWSSASGGSTFCDAKATAVPLIGGHFSVALPDGCATSIHTYPNAWVEVLVDGASLGRTKLGGVPYALEAAHATASDSATNATNAVNATGASGALQTTLDGHGTRIAALEAALATKLSHVDGFTAARSAGNPAFANCWNATHVAANVGQWGFCGELCQTSCKSAGYLSGWFNGGAESNATDDFLGCVCVK